MNVTVLGAGTMGHGIAQVSAGASHAVTLHDIDEDRLREGIESIETNLDGGIERGKVSPEEKRHTLERITTTTSLEAALADSDLVIEAVPEDLDLKHDVFSSVEEVVDETTIIASNTSSLSLTAIAAVLERPERAIGMHFFNPVHIMGLVEIVEAEQTEGAIVDRSVGFVEGLEKTPIVVADYPGFASSRLGVSLGVEAIRMVEQGVASTESIDTAMTLGYNHPVGPLELTDVVGLDVRLDVLEYLTSELGERFRPPQLLKRKVQAGKLGRKTGEGFYVWEDGESVGPSDSP